MLTCKCEFYEKYDGDAPDGSPIILQYLWSSCIRCNIINVFKGDFDKIKRQPKPPSYHRKKIKNLTNKGEMLKW